MPTRRVVNHEEPETPARRRRPAATPEARENQLIALAYDLVEKRLIAGTASSQEVSHWLKMGSSREKLEQERLRNENQLTQAKIEAMAAHARIEEMYGRALEAMKSYSGQAPREIGSDYDD